MNILAAGRRRDPLCSRVAHLTFEPAAPRLIQGVWPRSLVLWMVGLYIALFVIRPWEKLVPQLAELRIERVYAVCMIVAVLVAGARIGWSLQTATVLGFLGAMGLSAGFAWKSSLAWEPFYKCATLVVFYFVLISVIRSTYALLFVVSCYLVAMAVYLFKALWEFFVHGAHHYTMGVVRLIGIEYTFGGPNDLATSVVVSLPLLLLIFTVRGELCATWPAWLRRLVVPACLGYLAMALVAIQLTKSRAGMVAFVVLVGLVAWRAGSWKARLRLAALGALLLGALWVVMPAEAKERLRTVWDPKAGPVSAHESAEGRVAGLKAGLEMFRRYPLLGVGIGNFVPYRMRYLDAVPSEAHNLVGQILGETGLVGALAFLALIGAVLLNVHRVQQLARQAPQAGLDVLVRVTLAARDVVLLLLFDGIFGHNLLRFNWLWMAAFALISSELAAAAVRRQRAAEATGEPAVEGLALVGAR